MNKITTAFYDLALTDLNRLLGGEPRYPYLQDLNELWAIGIIKDEMTYDEYSSVETYLMIGERF